MSSSNTPKNGMTAPSSPSDGPAQNSGAQNLEATPSPSLDKMDFSPAPDAAPSESVPQSQPMTATASNSSEHPPTESHDANAAAPYGTRSRNRPTGSRPNYADDKELDLEIEAAGKISKSTKKTAAAAAMQQQQHSPSTEPDTHPRNSGATNAVNGGAPGVNGITTVPGSGHYDVLPPVQPTSKKRKAPGSNTTVTSAPASSIRTKSATVSHARSFTETNMMSFDRCGYRLNAKQQLVADDGTALERNGKCFNSCYRQCLIMA